MAKIVTEEVPLTCATIGSLDNGVADLLINAEIAKAIADLSDRGNEDGKPRKVTIEIEMTMKNGLPIVAVACQAKLPARRSNDTVTKERMSAKNKSELLFMEWNRDNPDQATFSPNEE